jgi:type I restriction enzyme M protein
MAKDLGTEEDVKIKFLLPLLESLGYKRSFCEFDKDIEVQEGRKRKHIFADVVVHTSAKKNSPLILCETKSPNEVLNRFVKEQAISYARLLPRIAPLVVITNGLQIQVFQTLNKNRIAELPSRHELKTDLLEFIVSRELQDALRQEAKHGLFIIDDVNTFKTVLKSCHNEIRNNEGYDPTVAFDEMSKVLFCKLYEEKHSHGNRFRLGVFDDTLERLHVNVVKQIFEETKKDSRYSGLFAADATINLQDRTVKKIVGLFENYDLSLTAFDVKGEAFEYFLGDTFTGGLGEYFTPRNIVEFIVEAIDPKIGEKIIDPFCGTGGFLIYGFEVVSEKIRLQEFSNEEKARWRLDLSNRSLFGTDWKERTSQACKMNMMVHGDGSAGIFLHHGLLDVEGKFAEGQFDICLTNPPFGSIENDPSVLARYELGAARKAQDRVILAVERAIRLVKPLGWVGIIVNDGVLNNDTTRPIRDFIKRNAWVKAVISLAKETFEGYGSRAKTSVLLLQKKADADDGLQNMVFMAVAKNTGYAANGGQIPGNELPDILMAYKAFLRGDTVYRQHSDSWVAEVGDRLDAEFYSRRHEAGATNLASLRKSVSELVARVSKEHQALEAALPADDSQEEYETVVIEDILEEVQVKEPVVTDRIYRLIGVRWWGGGAFVREEKLGRKIKGKTLCRLSPRWLIYNRLFAFRGSFALLGDEHGGCYASTEFPTFTVRKSAAGKYGEPWNVAKYVVHCLNSPQYLQIVNALSTGSTKTSRNRLNQRLLLKVNISIPTSPEAVSRVVQLLDRADALRSTQQVLMERVKEFRQDVARLLPLPPARTGPMSS